MPLEIRAVGQDSYWVIHQMQAVCRFLSHDTFSAFASKDPMKRGHRIGNSILYADDPDGTQDGRRLLHRGALAQQEAGNLNSCDGGLFVIHGRHR